MNHRVGSVSLIEFGLCEPNCQQLAQQLALVDLADVGAWSVAIFLQDTRNKFNLSGQFGLGIESEQRVVDIVESQYSRLISLLAQDNWVTNVPDIVNDLVVSLEDFALDIGPVVVAPLRVPSHMFGLLFICSMDQSKARDVVNRMIEIRSVVSLVALREYRAHLVGGYPVVPPPELTKRQKIILERMSMGETNLVISKHIGYSESTVRHETLRIYRFFKVHDRRSAALAAQAFNSLEDQKTRE